MGKGGVPRTDAGLRAGWRLERSAAARTIKEGVSVAANAAGRPLTEGCGGLLTL